MWITPKSILSLSKQQMSLSSKIAQNKSKTTNNKLFSEVESVDLFSQSPSSSSISGILSENHSFKQFFGGGKKEGNKVGSESKEVTGGATTKKRSSDVSNQGKLQPSQNAGKSPSPAKPDSSSKGGSGSNPSVEKGNIQSPVHGKTSTKGGEGSGVSAVEEVNNKAFALFNMKPGEFKEHFEQNENPFPVIHQLFDYDPNVTPENIQVYANHHQIKYVPVDEFFAREHHVFKELYEKGGYTEILNSLFDPRVTEESIEDYARKMGIKQTAGKTVNPVEDTGLTQENAQTTATEEGAKKFSVNEFLQNQNQEELKALFRRSYQAVIEDVKQKYLITLPLKEVKSYALRNNLTYRFLKATPEEQQKMLSDQATKRSRQRQQTDSHSLVYPVKMEKLEKERLERLAIRDKDPEGLLPEERAQIEKFGPKGLMQSISADRRNDGWPSAKVQQAMAEQKEIKERERADKAQEKAARDQEKAKRRDEEKARIAQEKTEAAMEPLTEEEKAKRRVKAEKKAASNRAQKAKKKARALAAQAREGQESQPPSRTQSQYTPSEAGSTASSLKRNFFQIALNDDELPDVPNLPSAEQMREYGLKVLKQSHKQAEKERRASQEFQLPARLPEENLVNPYLEQNSQPPPTSSRNTPKPYQGSIPQLPPLGKVSLPFIHSFNSGQPFLAPPTSFPRSSYAPPNNPFQSSVGNLSSPFLDLDRGLQRAAPHISNTQNPYQFPSPGVFPPPQGAGTFPPPISRPVHTMTPQSPYVPINTGWPPVVGSDNPYNQPQYGQTSQQYGFPPQQHPQQSQQYRQMTPQQGLFPPLSSTPVTQTLPHWRSPSAPQQPGQQHSPFAQWTPPKPPPEPKK